MMIVPTGEKDSVTRSKSFFSACTSATESRLIATLFCTAFSEILKSYPDHKPFLDFEEKQTTALEKLKNPAGHYRRTVDKFYEAGAKRRDWDIRSQMRALEKKIGRSAGAPRESRTCSLARCNGTGECWDKAGYVSPCACEIGQSLPPKVLTAFEQMTHSRTNAEGLHK